MTATTEAPTQAPPAPRPPLFGKQERRAIADPLWDNNPISLQVLGICSALAVTTQMAPTLVMCLAVVFVLCMSNVVVSVLRDLIPGKIRIIVMLVVISSLVTIVDLFLRAFAYDISKQLSVFVGLIVTNCIIMGRAEAFAMSNRPFRSFLDGLGNALGYSWILISVAFFRELLGSGTLLGYRVVPASIYADPAAGTGWYINNGIMVLAPGAFLLLGIIVWIQRGIAGYSESH